MIYGPRKGFGPEDSGYRRANWRASARVWRGKSVDLEPPRDYHLNIGGEMRSGWPDLQTQVRKLQERSDLKSQNLMRGARRLKVSFSGLGKPGRN